MKNVVVAIIGVILILIALFVTRGPLIANLFVAISSSPCEHVRGTLPVSKMIEICHAAAEIRHISEAQQAAEMNANAAREECRSHYTYEMAAEAACGSK